MMNLNRRNFIRNLTGSAAGFTLAGIMPPSFAKEGPNKLVQKQDENISKIYLSFKAHWDIGFTTSARKLLHNIINWHFPTVIATGKQLKDKDVDPKLVVTFGSWMVREGLERLKGEQLINLEKAIEEDTITWNAMPFTMHSEYYERSLYEYCLNISKRLDDQFGKKTIVAKLTDVPCHTISIVPLLADAGIQFLHVGVNWMCHSPEVPPVFLWKHQDGSEIVVMYDHSGYGGTQTLKGHNEILGLIMKGDNMDPWTYPEVKNTIDVLNVNYPNAKMLGARMDKFVPGLLKYRDEMPIITEEFGDTWVFGTGSDPKKTAQFRALSRLRQKWLEAGKLLPNQKQYHIFSTHLSLIGEHTWGVDHNTYMWDRENYETKAFQNHRGRSNYRIMEESWKEQREYITDGILGLEDGMKKEAEEVLETLEPVKPDTNEYIEIKPEQQQSGDGYSITFDDDGSLSELTINGVNWAGEQNKIGVVSYQTFDAEDFKRYFRQYYENYWAGLDESANGIEKSYAESKFWKPEKVRIWKKDNKYLSVINFNDNLAVKYGVPKYFTLQYTFSDFDKLRVELQWFEKQACKLPEAIWFSFFPAQEGNWKFSKIGQKIDPTKVVSRGGRNMHSIDKNIELESNSGNLDIQSLDANLVSPGTPAIIDFHNKLPDFSKGVHFNLFNNLWQTNFVAWYEDDAKFRFELNFK